MMILILNLIFNLLCMVVIYQYKLQKRILNKAMFKVELFEKPKEQRPVLVSDNGTQLVSKLDFSETMHEIRNKN